MATTNLKKVQLGQEAIWGTGVAATAILMGVTDSSIDVTDEAYQAEEQGFLSPSSVVINTKHFVEASIDYDLSYEDILYMLDGAFGDCTPGGVGPYTWDYAAPMSAAVAPREYTMEYGMTDGEYEMAGAIFNDFTISGDVDGDGVWQASCGLIGKSVTAAAMTALSRRDVSLIRMSDTVLTIDAVGGTMGGTAIAGALISFELSIEPKYHLKFFAGAYTPANFGYDRWDGQLTLVLEFTADVKAYVDSLITPALVEKQIRLYAISGADEAGIDFAGFLADGVTLFEDRDGNVTVSLGFQGQYNSTMGNWLEFNITNDVDVLT